MDGVQDTKMKETPTPQPEEDSSEGGEEDPFMANVNAQNAGQSYAQCAPTEQQRVFWWIYPQGRDEEPKHYPNETQHTCECKRIQNGWHNEHPNTDLWFCPKTCRPFRSEQVEAIDQWVKTDCEKWIKQRNIEELQKQNAVETQNTSQVITSTTSITSRASQEAQDISTNDAGYEN